MSKVKLRTVTGSNGKNSVHLFRPSKIIFLITMTESQKY